MLIKLTKGISHIEPKKSRIRITTKSICNNLSMNQEQVKLIYSLSFNCTVKPENNVLDSFSKKDFYTPPPPKICNRLLYCILKIAQLLYCLLKKAGQKAGQKKSAKSWQKRQQKFLFLNLYCCCLETGLKPVLLILK